MRVVMDTLGDAQQKCEARSNSGRPCQAVAGAGTGHFGAGRCFRHLGNTERGNAEGVMIMVHAIAVHRRIDPEEALLEEMHRSAGEVAWLDSVLGKAASDLDLIEGGKLYSFVQMWQKQRVHYAAVSRAAVTMGVVERASERLRVYAETIVNVMNKALEASGLPDDQKIEIRANLRREMSALDAAGVIEGEHKEYAYGQGEDHTQ